MLALGSAPLGKMIHESGGRNALLPLDEIAALVRASKTFPFASYQGHPTLVLIRCELLDVLFHNLGKSIPDEVVRWAAAAAATASLPRCRHADPRSRNDPATATAATATASLGWKRRTSATSGRGNRGRGCSFIRLWSGWCCSLSRSAGDSSLLLAGSRRSSRGRSLPLR